ncbi:hypothetical protein L0Y34_00600 [Candidatus Parcubacteria bacterium]|nr:hypothetical protein [Candidatus Parcubacteria bacterium]
MGFREGLEKAWRGVKSTAERATGANERAELERFIERRELASLQTSHERHQALRDGAQESANIYSQIDRLESELRRLRGLADASRERKESLREEFAEHEQFEAQRIEKVKQLNSIGALTQSFIEKWVFFKKESSVERKRKSLHREIRTAGGYKKLVLDDLRIEKDNRARIMDALTELGRPGGTATAGMPLPTELFGEHPPTTQV